MSSAGPSNFTKDAVFGIPVEDLEEKAVCQMSDRKARELRFRFSTTSKVDGIVFFSPAGDRVTARLRRDQPQHDPEGKPKNKHISPFGDRRPPLFHWWLCPLLADTSVSVVTVKAEKSALAIQAMARRLGRSVFVFACGACWGWMSTIGKDVTPKGEREHVKRSPAGAFSDR